MSTTIYKSPSFKHEEHQKNSSTESESSFEFKRVESSFILQEEKANSQKSTVILYQKGKTKSAHSNSKKSLEQSTDSKNKEKFSKTTANKVYKKPLSEPQKNNSYITPGKPEINKKGIKNKGDSNENHKDNNKISNGPKINNFFKTDPKLKTELQPKKMSGQNFNKKKKINLTTNFNPKSTDNSNNSNTSGTEKLNKMKNYKVPTPKRKKKEKEESEEESVSGIIQTTQEAKYMMMNNLIEGALRGIKKEVSKEVDIEDEYKRKYTCLEEQGALLNSNDEEEEQDENENEKTEKENDNSYNIHQKKKSKKKNKNRINSCSNRSSQISGKDTEENKSNYIKHRNDTELTQNEKSNYSDYNKSRNGSSYSQEPKKKIKERIDPKGYMVDINQYMPENSFRRGNSSDQTKKRKTQDMNKYSETTNLTNKDKPIKTREEREEIKEYMKEKEKERKIKEQTEIVENLVKKQTYYEKMKNLQDATFIARVTAPKVKNRPKAKSRPNRKIKNEYYAGYGKNKMIKRKESESSICSSSDNIDDYFKSKENVKNILSSSFTSKVYSKTNYTPNPEEIINPMTEEEYGNYIYNKDFKNKTYSNIPFNPHYNEGGSSYELDSYEEPASNNSRSHNRSKSEDISTDNINLFSNYEVQKLNKKCKETLERASLNSKEYKEVMKECNNITSNNDDIKLTTENNHDISNNEENNDNIKHQKTDNRMSEELPSSCKSEKKLSQSQPQKYSSSNIRLSQSQHNSLSASRYDDYENEEQEEEDKQDSIRIPSTIVFSDKPTIVDDTNEIQIPKSLRSVKESKPNTITKENKDEVEVQDIDNEEGETIDNKFIENYMNNLLFLTDVYNKILKRHVMSELFEYTNNITKMLTSIHTGTEMVNKVIKRNYLRNLINNYKSFKIELFITLFKQNPIYKQQIFYFLSVLKIPFILDRFSMGITDIKRIIYGNIFFHFSRQNKLIQLANMINDFCYTISNIFSKKVFYSLLENKKVKDKEKAEAKASRDIFMKMKETVQRQQNEIAINRSNLTIMSNNSEGSSIVESNIMNKTDRFEDVAPFSPPVQQPMKKLFKGLKIQKNKSNQPKIYRTKLNSNNMNDNSISKSESNNSINSSNIQNKSEEDEKILFHPPNQNNIVGNNNKKKGITLSLSEHDISADNDNSGSGIFWEYSIHSNKSNSLREVFKPKVPFQNEKNKEKESSHSIEYNTGEKKLSPSSSSSKQQPHLESCTSEEEIIDFKISPKVEEGTSSKKDSFDYDNDFVEDELVEGDSHNDIVRELLEGQRNNSTKNVLKSRNNLVTKEEQENDNNFSSGNNNHNNSAINIINDKPSSDDDEEKIIICENNPHNLAEEVNISSLSEGSHNHCESEPKTEENITPQKEKDKNQNEINKEQTITTKDEEPKNETFDNINLPMSMEEKKFNKQREDDNQISKNNLPLQQDLQPTPIQKTPTHQIIPKEEEQVILNEEQQLVKEAFINQEEEKKKIDQLSKEDKDKLIESITNEILSSLMFSEIEDKNKKLGSKSNVTKKRNLSSANSLTGSFERPTNNYNLNSSDYSNSMGNEDPSLNNSQIFNDSIFMVSMTEKKKEEKLLMYKSKIAPSFIGTISKEIDVNYPQIIQNLQIPYIKDPSRTMNGIIFQSDQTHKDPNSNFINQSDLDMTEFIQKDLVLNKYDKNPDIPVNQYDEALNECLVDAANEIIQEERLYGRIGKPLPWSLRQRETGYKHKNNEFAKKNFVKKITDKLTYLSKYEIGLIQENLQFVKTEDFVQERDRKICKAVSEDMKDEDAEYLNFENEETYVKLVLSNIIREQLLNEVVEILEHVQYSRRQPDKYDNKSIFACENIPKLKFQLNNENGPNMNMRGNVEDGEEDKINQ